MFVGTFKQGVTPRSRPLRLRLAIGVLPLFLLAPIFIRHASGDNVEDVPAIEGIFYALMALLVMVADQWIVSGTPKERNDDRDRRLRRMNVAVALIGLALVAFVPLLGEVAIETYMPFVAVFGTLTILLSASGLAIAHWFGRLTKPARRGIEIAAAIAIVLLYCAYGWMPRIPHLVSGILLFFVVGLQIWYAFLFGVESRYGRAKPRGFQWLITLAAVFVVAQLCWPESRGATAWSFLTAVSMRVTTGAFFLSLGFILLIVAGALWSYRGEKYDGRSLKEVGMAMIVLLAYALSTLLTMMMLTWLLPELVTPLELTPRFWWVLAAVSLTSSVIILRLGSLRRFSSTAWARALQFLREPHPNGVVIHRRYGRILAVSVVAVTWWNVVTAPALYGNRTARDYHNRAIREFTKQNGAFAPTARFVAPANLLQRNGTRYFMFLADDERECPAISHTPASGARWWVYGGDGVADDKRCVSTPARATLAKRVAFASGSPFPIFPAHRVDEAPDDAPYIDGGYSNDVPLDAARTLQARQVLIIDSSNPLPPVVKQESWMDVVREKTLGYLVVNLATLPSYLFERSQQLDRLSRADLFVVTLAPSRYEDDWPKLFDFRASVVERMRDTAEHDLHNRIGIVESWGQPSFSLHVDVPPPAPRG